MMSLKLHGMHNFIHGKINIFRLHNEKCEDDAYVTPSFSCLLFTNTSRINLSNLITNCHTALLPPFHSYLCVCVSYLVYSLPSSYLLVLWSFYRYWILAIATCLVCRRFVEASKMHRRMTCTNKQTHSPKSPFGNGGDDKDNDCNDGNAFQLTSRCNSFQ